MTLRTVYLNATLLVIYLLSRPAVAWLWLLGKVGEPVAKELEQLH